MCSRSGRSASVYSGATGSLLSVVNSASRSGTRENRSRNQRSASVIGSAIVMALQSVAFR